MNGWGPWEREEGLDKWHKNHLDSELRSCSFCGSVDPEQFLQGLDDGRFRIGTTDKDYKIYIMPSHAKCYFQHFDGEQRQRFIDIYNEHRLTPGRLFETHKDFDGSEIIFTFSVLPFFMTKAPPSAT